MQRLWKQAGAASRGVMILVGAVALVAGVLVPTQLVRAAGSSISVLDYSQCANGGPSNPATDFQCQSWINGILNANNSHFSEDQVTPQRATLMVPTAGTHTLTIRYLVRKADAHAYDSLATWNKTVSDLNETNNPTDVNSRCYGIANCPDSPRTETPIPDNPLEVTPATAGGTATTPHMRAQADRQFIMFGGTLQAFGSGPNYTASGGKDLYHSITVSFTTADPNQVVQLLFGGHLAAPTGSRGWGAGLGASSISGGPYHIKLDGADGASLGNRDNQIQSSAIIPILAETNVTTSMGVRLTDTAIIDAFDSEGPPSGPRGTMFFELYGPDSPDCDSTVASPVYTAAVGNVATSIIPLVGSVSTPWYEVPANATGTWNWVVDYTGDDANKPFGPTACGSESVAINYNF